MGQGEVRVGWIDLGQLSYQDQYKEIFQLDASQLSNRRSDGCKNSLFDGAHGVLPLANLKLFHFEFEIWVSVFQISFEIEAYGNLELG